MTTSQEPQATFDVLLVGVGGQGVLTIGELLTEAAFRQGIPVSFYPSKGMAQRGGFVKAQLRLGREGSGPNIPLQGADLVIATEVSEALKGLPFLRPGGDFVLFAYVWAPTEVMLGKAPYPALEEVVEAARRAGASVHVISPDSLPVYEGAPVPANVYLLGFVVARTGLSRVLEPETVAQAIAARWPKGADRNLFAFQSPCLPLSASPHHPVTDPS
jgi:indolepyruvate ferredoxin oxidoreductase beta subunit